MDGPSGALHPFLRGVDWLIGTWEGTGRGIYATIEPFDYGEEIRFSDVGRPFLLYAQRTWSLADGQPLHAETGWLRPREDGRIELIVAQATGVGEVDEGTVDGRRISLDSVAVTPTSTGASASQVSRRIEVSADGSTLRYTLDMEAVGQPLQRHLEAELRRVGA